MADSPFSVTHATWLKTEADRVGGFILMPKFWGKKWTHKKLKQELLDIGLDYTLTEVAELNDELHKRGIVEDVTVTPAPEPALVTPAAE